MKQLVTTMMFAFISLLFPFAYKEEFIACAICMSISIMCVCTLAIIEAIEGGNK